jgi:hypothetical protein
MFRFQKSTIKTMLMTFLFLQTGVIHTEFVAEGQIVNVDVIRRLLKHFPG